MLKEGKNKLDINEIETAIKDPNSKYCDCIRISPFILEYFLIVPAISCKDLTEPRG